MMRDPLAVKAKFIECIVIALFYGIMFYRTPNYITHPTSFTYNWEQVTDINVSCEYPKGAFKFNENFK